MLANLLLPLSLLACIVAGFVWVAKTSRDRRDLQKRLADVVPTGALQQLNREDSDSIRVRPGAESRFAAYSAAVSAPGFSAVGISVANARNESDVAVPSA